MKHEWKMIAFRVTEEQKKDIQKRAHDEYSTLSTYIKRRIFKGD